MRCADIRSAKPGENSGSVEDAGLSGFGAVPGA